MEQFLVSIEKSIEVENWMSAIFTSLCIPDICGAAENKIQGNGARYRDWFNRYMNDKYSPDNVYQLLLFNAPEKLKILPFDIVERLKHQPANVCFTAEDCWALRNACLHQGKDEQKIKKFRITIPAPGSNVVHLNSCNGAIQLDAKILCFDLVSAARKWMLDFKDDIAVSHNVATMMHIKDLSLVF